ncbi:uncharacterized protein ARB_04346 [Trichophyton benhamiae CBS 112371]|uniref:F-box domain-containing protein n=1 Tax=Arthroderma benhamiae (strain ATCC MYA-4681 / CBS 112371) TaxID=663331 RepID=D4AJ97_ARTBC|nr:uncharacterized protein ARB_04346 [Trichophyton benhamiae CBS 112371]EFE36820.1 hypothetical protein ARB_04346 [Trichophyton benhamiae CBS 112371]
MTLAKLEDLPEDILVLIFPLLDVPDFLALCTVNKYFHEVFLTNPEFWREVTTKTFRVPVQPLLRANGPRWYWLYKNLRTQTRVYQWGGEGRPSEPLVNKTWPYESSAVAGIRNIVDLQCGSVLNQLPFCHCLHYGVFYDYSTASGYQRLKFDTEYPATSVDSYNKSTAIKQFSSGRRHILGLSDEGIIWSWSHRDHSAKLVEFSCARTVLNSRDPHTPGTVTKVVSGWDTNSAFVAGTGIVYWKINDPPLNNDESVLLIVPGKIVPGTGFQRTNSERGRAEDEAGLGEVISYIVLERCIVFITDLNKVFATEGDGQRTVELAKFAAPERILKDIQGAFRNFAVFTETGEVMIGNAEHIQTAFDFADDPDRVLSPKFPAGLQHSEVISVSFGDYHYTALHANGKVSSYGREPGGCGSLGLGSALGGTPLRGLTGPESEYFDEDVYYFEFAEEKRHNVWFEPEKREWLKYLAREAESEEDSLDWLTPLKENDHGLLEKYSTCIERAGEHWDNFPDIKPENTDGLGAYFVLSVASAGWQTVALVLVDKELAEKVRRKHLVNVEESNDAEETPRYKWELQKYPPLQTNAQEIIEVNKYDFDTWVYGLPPLENSSIQE